MRTRAFLLIGALVAVGARADEPKTNAAPEISITPIGQYVTVKGDVAKFREYSWGNDGWTEGGEATLHQDLGKDVSLDFEGRGIINDEDYRLRLDITKKDVGFVRAGFTEYRQYFDGKGGFFKSFNPQSFTLNSGEHLDIGDIFVDVGLTLPNVPKITLGYERQFKDGVKSMLEWGGVTQGTETRKIYPSSKNVDETVNIYKVGIEHDIKDVHLADQFRYERYDAGTKRTDTSLNLNTTASQAVTVRESYRHDAFFNTFQLDSHLNEKVYWSLGYLYTTLNGNGDLDVATAPTTSPFDHNWSTRVIDVDVNSHVVNFNAMFGPFKGLTICAGLQAEKTDSDGFTDALLTDGAGPTTANVIHSSDNKSSLEETLGLRYTKIPFTTLYAEARLTEQQIDLNERETQDGSATLGEAFTRKTDTDVFRQDYRAGFNTSPMRRVTLSGRYRHAIYHNDYDNRVDTEPGYPAFITAQDFTTDEVMGKLTLRPCSRFSVALTYQLVSTEIETDNGGVPLLAPNGSKQSGNYDASIYSVSATVTPLSRLYLTGLFSFQDTRTTTFDNGNPSVITYRGNVYTIMGAAGYALDNKTDVNIEYTYSRSDNFTDNSADGLPLGLDYQRHGLIVGLARKITNHVIARLRYGWYEYNESSNGGINNYTAQLASASCTVRF